MWCRWAGAGVGWIVCEKAPSHMTWKPPAAMSDTKSQDQRSAARPQVRLLPPPLLGRARRAVVGQGEGQGSGAGAGAGAGQLVDPYPAGQGVRVEVTQGQERFGEVVCWDPASKATSPPLPFALPREESSPGHPHPEPHPGRALQDPAARHQHGPRQRDPPTRGPATFLPSCAPAQCGSSKGYPNAFALSNPMETAFLRFSRRKSSSVSCRSGSGALSRWT